MNEEEINKMCSDIYEGEDWQPMKDYIKSLQNQLQQKENKEKEIRKYIEKEREKMKNHQYAVGIRRLNKIENILDKEVN